jgi:hypothetical protein
MKNLVRKFSSTPLVAQDPINRCSKILTIRSLRDRDAKEAGYSQIYIPGRPFAPFSYNYKMILGCTSSENLVATQNLYSTSDASYARDSLSCNVISGKALGYLVGEHPSIIMETEVSSGEKIALISHEGQQEKLINRNHEEAMRKGLKHYLFGDKKWIYLSEIKENGERVPASFGGEIISFDERDRTKEELKVDMENLKAAYNNEIERHALDLRHLIKMDSMTSFSKIIAIDIDQRAIQINPKYMELLKQKKQAQEEQNTKQSPSPSIKKRDELIHNMVSSLSFKDDWNRGGYD